MKVSYLTVLLLIFLASTVSAQTMANSTNYIYSILFPIFAVAFTLSIFLDNEQQLLIIMKPMLSTIFWFASAPTAINIRQVGDFTVSMNTYYVDRGNPEVSTLFTAVGIIIAVYTLLTLIIMIMEYLDEKNTKNNG